MDDMTEAELFAHVQALQEASTNVQAMKTKVVKKKAKNTERKQQIKAVLDDLLS